MKKKLIGLFVLALLLFGMGTSIYAAAIEEVPLTSYKDGTIKNVYHYGTGDTVTLPKKYFNVESEMRGVWVATVYNIAIKKQQGLNAEGIAGYKAEFLSILDRMEAFGMNTLFFQVRPSNDAFYQSKLNPWSEFLAGAGINPGWDPLEWMIEETHKRGFTFQCWMNAFRVTTFNVLPNPDKNASYYANDVLLSRKSDVISNLPDNSFAKLHPEYVLMGDHDPRLILNPSEPAVQQFIVDTIMEIVENYDVDGLHFDDYFYLNGSVSSDKENTNFAGGTKYNQALTGANILNDLPNYKEYQENPARYNMKSGYSLGDFRRENLNNMMREIRKAIDAYNLENHKYVEFGSKPAAVWRSNSEYCGENPDRCVPTGSNTHANAYTSYNDLFADTLQWVKEGLVDYMAPQIYYAFEDQYAPFADVVDWWAQQIDQVNAKRAKEQKKPIKLYIAHGIYKYRDNPDQFYNVAEMLNQLKYTRKYDCIKGSAVYSYETLYIFSNNKAHEPGVKLFKDTWANNPTYPLAYGPDDSQGLTIGDQYKVSSNAIGTKYVITFPKQNGAKVYGLYKVAKGKTLDASDIGNRIGVSYAPYVNDEYVSMNIDQYETGYDYYIKAVSNRNHLSQESVKINLDIAEKNVAPNPVTVHLSGNQKYLFDETVRVSFAFATDPNDDKLSYQLLLLEDGKEGHVSTDLSSLIQVEDGKMICDWQAYFIDIDEGYFKLVIRDDELETVCYSAPFSLKAKYSADSQDPKPSGCKCKKTNMYVVNLLGCGILLLLLRKKK